MTVKTKRSRPVLAIVVLVLSLAALYFGHGKRFVSLALDPHDATCLPELHLALLVYAKPKQPSQGDYVFFKPFGALSYVEEGYVLKKVAGVPGDRLLIKDGLVFINGKQVGKGFEDAVLYKKVPRDFEKNESIPAGQYFVIGTAPMSNDSRYWGYLAAERIVGTGYRLY